MEIPGPLEEAAFVDRPNRFVMVVDVDGRRVRAHCPNPGRLAEFLDPGRAFLVRPVAAADRATDADVVAGRHNDGWVVLDTRLANDLVAEALVEGRLDDAFPGLSDHRTEPAHADGRLDLRLETDDGPVLVEVKSVTLLSEDDRETGLFPDAPTVRGTRHARELAALAREGHRAALVFVAMRSDVRRIRPHRKRDPDFAAAVRDAVQAGVEVLGYRTRLVGTTLRLEDEVPVEV